MDEDADGRARAQLRRLSRGLTGTADFRLEVALAVHQLGKGTFAVHEISDTMRATTAGRSDNAARNLQAFVAAGLLKQPIRGGPYERDERHPFWRFIADTWTILLAEAHSAEEGEAALSAISQTVPLSTSG
jgi:hypothetical protein